MLCGERIMSSAKEYREFADECLDWAGTAKSARERRIFLQMAEAWLGAAARLDVKNHPGRYTKDALKDFRCALDRIINEASEGQVDLRMLIDALDRRAAALRVMFATTRSGEMKP